ncbi:hypothetical protein ACS0TW_37690, partial [Klebsiella michiganensis]
MSYTRHLVGYGLVQKGASGYSFNFEEISDLLRKKHNNERLNLTDDEKVQEISIRRNRLEKAMRVFIRNSLKISKGSNKAKDTVIAAVPEGRRSMLINYDLSGILDRDSSPLFFLELINIVKREWTNFENVFDI